jgi:hypothetical protein
VANVVITTTAPPNRMFGPSSPHAWGPPAGLHRVLWAGREGDPHADRPDPGLLAIGVRDVVRELAALAGQGTAA